MEKVHYEDPPDLGVQEAKRHESQEDDSEAVHQDCRRKG